MDYLGNEEEVLILILYFVFIEMKWYVSIKFNFVVETPNNQYPIMQEIAEEVKKLLEKIGYSKITYSLDNTEFSSGEEGKSPYF